MNQSIKQSKAGFTIIELVLSMAFVSMLLLAVASTAIFLSNIYAKGTTMQLVNQTGREVTDLLRRDLLQADQSNVTVFSGPNNATAAWGRLCLGEYSYVWNTADGLNNPSATLVRTAGSSEPVRLLRVKDTNRTVCAQNGGGAFAMQVATTDETVDLLGDASGNSQNPSRLAVHSLEVAELASSGNQRLRNVTLRLGTSDTSAFDGSGNDRQCSMSGSTNANANNNYCAVSTFTFFVRATNVK
ncbi:type II secretion system protein [Candidatus Saccharibacteria bacterium]|nr:type II secretion system protein [Candidatus Saccharibacteria bacterium]